jgi:hypothetical protein
MSALFTIEWSAGTPTLRDAAALLHVPESALDAHFGVVSIDPAHHLFAVRSLGDDTTDKNKPGAAGPYSDPQIEGFGPPRRQQG